MIAETELTPIDNMADEFTDMPAVDMTISHKEANYILRRIAGERRQLALIAEQAADEIGRIQARANELKQAVAAREEWLVANYGHILEDFARQELEGQKARSVSLLAGKVGFRKSPASVEIVDADAALVWAKTNCEDAIKESILKTPIKKYIEETGEVPTGVEYLLGEDKFYMDMA